MGGVIPGVGGAGRSSSSGSGGAGAPSGNVESTNRDEFFGDSRCDSAGVWLCDDFESGVIDTQRWQAMFKLPTIDSVHAARGKNALHVSTSATEGSGVRTDEIFPTPNENYWGRIFVYFEALPSSPDWAHWTVVAAEPSDGSSIKREVRVGGQRDTKSNRFGVGSDGGPTGDWTLLDQDPRNAAAVPEGQWLCVEWQHDGANDHTRFFWDGIEHPSLGTTADDHGGNKGARYELPQFSSVWIGFWNYDQKKPVTPNHFDVWIDEIALNGERIGCAR
jgi:hypothetical protein